MTVFFGPVNLWNYPKQLRDYRMTSDHEKAMQQAGGIDATLKERGNRYGPFDGHARITQSLKDCMSGKYQVTNWDTLKPEQKEALEMIAHKIGRILNGDPNYDD